MGAIKLAGVRKQGLTVSCQHVGDLMHDTLCHVQWAMTDIHRQQDLRDGIYRPPYLSRTVAVTRFFQEPELSWIAKERPPAPPVTAYRPAHP
jgi:hypothetical protein